MKKTIAVLGVLALLATAAPAFAQVYYPGGYVAPGYTTPYSYPVSSPVQTQYACPALSYNLYVGLSDYRTQGQVTVLQQFLAGRGYYQPVTGYFGSMTRSNVAQFQQQQAVYPVTGGVGPLTRAAIVRTCQGGTVYPPATGGISISSVNGPNTLGVGQQGTWTITTNAPYNSYLSTSVRWGDENMYLYGTGSGVATSYTAGTNTFTHSYSQAGTYTITFGVTDNTGRSTSASATVVVGGGSSCNTYPYYTNCQAGLMVTSPTAGQTYTRGGQMPISWSGLVHQTFAYEQDSSIIDLYSVASGKVGTIAIQNGIAGSYTWGIPGFPQNYMCTMQYPNGLCGANIPDGQYYIKVTAVVGNGFDANATQIGSAQSGTFTISGAGGGCTGNCQATITATPQSGTVPLTVSFSVNNYSGQYQVSYGDGISNSLVSGTTAHTYYNRGTYTATFQSDLACMHTTPRCEIATQNLGSVVITVQ